MSEGSAARSRPLVPDPREAAADWEEEELESEEWKEKRAALLRNAKCERCGSTEDLRMLHTVRPMPLKEYGRWAARDLFEKWLWSRGIHDYPSQDHPLFPEFAADKRGEIERTAREHYMKDRGDYEEFKHVRVLCGRCHARERSWDIEE